ncbi:hypothetical protein N872_00290 [Neisseria meningitidis LNP27256]|nr:hypothetical protein N872_11405 [Neisseria meningitidis LNP27256]KID54539.1 hypothetical protein N872_00290 [Neisseria meningitidis LNP27256]
MRVRPKEQEAPRMKNMETTVEVKYQRNQELLN